MGKPLPWAGFSAMVPFSAEEQKPLISLEVSFPSAPSPFWFASASQILFTQLSFILISASSSSPVTTSHASLLTDSMSWRSHTCPTPVWCWVKRLLNFGSDDPGKEQNMFRTQLQLLCAFAYPWSRLSEPEGLIWTLGAAEWLHLPSCCPDIASMVQLPENYPCCALSSFPWAWVFTA